MNPPETSSELSEHEYKRGDSDVSRRYRELEADEVPPALDEAIINQAREEIQNTNRSRRWRRWTAPFAVAASAVVALSILLHAGSERETLITQQAPQVSAPPALAAVVPAPEQPNEPNAELEVNAESNEAPAAKVAPQSAAMPSPIPPPPKVSEPSIALERPVREKLEDVPAPAKTRAPRQFAMTQEERVQSPPAELANQSGASADAVTSQSVTAAPAPAELKKAVVKLDAAQVAERWLADIRKLRAEGHMDEADKQWREFRKSFPDYVVSTDDAARPKR